jgi:hypothetical protein
MVMGGYERALKIHGQVVVAMKRALGPKIPMRKYFLSFPQKIYIFFEGSVF